MTIADEQPGTETTPGGGAVSQAVSQTEEKPGIEPAFYAYEQSRKTLASAFLGRAKHDREAYEEAERRYRCYEEAMERALKNREKAERDALITYAETLAKAEEEAAEKYHQRMKLALNDCRREVEQAWIDSMATSGTMTGVFADDRVVPGQKRQSVLGAILSSVRETASQLKDTCLAAVRRLRKAPGRVPN